MMGGLIGLGGGVVMVPLMTAFARMTQHQAVGTSSLAVAAVGLSSCASFGSAGAVDFAAAAAVATTAMAGARVGAKLTTRFDAVQLQRVFATFQICVAPMVPAKAYLVQRAKASEQEATAATAVVPPVARGPEALLEPRKLWDERSAELAAMTAVGMVCGVAAGMFGIGGGVIVTPALCLLTEMPYATNPNPNPNPNPDPNPNPNLNPNPHPNPHPRPSRGRTRRRCSRGPPPGASSAPCSASRPRPRSCASAPPRPSPSRRARSTRSTSPSAPRTRGASSTSSTPSTCRYQRVGSD